MNNKNPLISVCVSYYNDSAFLQEHIESFLNSTYQNWELILLNHASTDNSREIAHSYSDPRIKHIDYPINIGAMGGLLLKECLNQAKGKYIKFFSADDFLAPDGLETLVKYMEENPDKDFAFGNVAYVDKNSQPLNDTWFESRKGFSLDYNEQQATKCFFDSMSIFPFAGQVIRADSLDKSYMNNNYILLFDMTLWSSFLINNKKFGLINHVVANYRIHDNQTTALNKREIADMRYRFEVEAYRKMWASITDIKTVKYLCSQSPYIDKMDDIKDIPFVMGEYFLRVCRSTYGYVILNDYFENTENVKYVFDKFGFSMKDFRALCAPLDVPKPENWRVCARRFKNVLSLKQIVYLFFYKLFKIKLFHKKTKKPKEYSL